ncbi:hypothetical protein D3C72_2208710 [compost metagenome]
MCWQTGELLQSPNHRIERVGDADDESVGSVFLDACADLFHDLQVDTKKIVAAHARLTRHTSGYDDNVCAFDCGIVICTGELRIKTVNR